MAAPKGNKFAKGGARPNSGPKKLSVRQLCAAEFEKRVPILCTIADDDKGRPLDRIAALKELARIGVPEKMLHEMTGKDGGPIETQSRQTFDYDGFKRALAGLRGGSEATNRLPATNGN